MPNENDIPLSDEERALAEKGEALIAAAVADTHAPQSLRERIERERERAQQMPPRASFLRRHLRPLAAVGTVTAAVAVVVALQSGSSAPESPSLAAVADVAQLQATQPAPAPRGGDPPILAARVSPIPFPDWQKSFGWRAVGSREDDVSGRTVKTVFYRNPEGAELGYSIVGGEPLQEHPPGREVSRAGDTYHVSQQGEHTLVAWTQQGHTCAIVASAAVPEARLVELAASRNT